MLTLTRKIPPILPSRFRKKNKAILGRYRKMFQMENVCSLRKSYYHKDSIEEKITSKHNTKKKLTLSYVASPPPAKYLSS